MDKLVDCEKYMNSSEYNIYEHDLNVTFKSMVDKQEDVLYSHFLQFNYEENDQSWVAELERYGDVVLGIILHDTQAPHRLMTLTNGSRQVGKSVIPSGKITHLPGRQLAYPIVAFQFNIVRLHINAPADWNGKVEIIYVIVHDIKERQQLALLRV